MSSLIKLQCLVTNVSGAQLLWVAFKQYMILNLSLIFLPPMYSHNKTTFHYMAWLIYCLYQFSGTLDMASMYDNIHHKYDLYTRKAFYRQNLKIGNHDDLQKPWSSPHTHVCTHWQIHNHINTDRHEHIHKYTHNYRYTYIHMHARTHICTYTNTQMCYKALG